MGGERLVKGRVRGRRSGRSGWQMADAGRLPDAPSPCRIRADLPGYIQDQQVSDWLSSSDWLSITRRCFSVSRI